MLSYYSPVVPLLARRIAFGDETILGKGGKIESLNGVPPNKTQPSQGSCGGGGGTELTSDDRKSMEKILLASGKYTMDAQGKLIKK